MSFIPKIRQNSDFIGIVKFLENDWEYFISHKKELIDRYKHNNKIFSFIKSQHFFLGINIK